MKANYDPIMFTEAARFSPRIGQKVDVFLQGALGIADNTAWIVHDEIPNFVDNTIRLDTDVLSFA